MVVAKLEVEWRWGCQSEMDNQSHRRLIVIELELFIKYNLQIYSLSLTEPLPSVLIRMTLGYYLGH